MNVRSKAMSAVMFGAALTLSTAAQAPVHREAGDVDAGPDQAGSSQARDHHAGDAEAGHAPSRQPRTPR